MPVNIISVLKLGEEYKAAGLCDGENTSILTAGRKSIFKWQEGQYTRTVIHPAHGLPEIDLNPGFSSFTSIFENAKTSCYDRIAFSSNSYHTKDIPLK